MSVDSTSDKINLFSKERQRLQDEKDQERRRADALEKQLRDPLVDSLVHKSRGLFSANDLEELSLDDLQLMQRTFVGDVADTYGAFLEQRERKRQADAAESQRGVIGAYNSETGKFEGGANL
jgi:hypothetical protein